MIIDIVVVVIWVSEFLVLKGGKKIGGDES